MKIVAFSGSLRKESFTTKLVKNFAKRAPEGTSLELVDISGLPMYNQDLEENLPESVRQLHQTIEQADAVLFATPEYNRSYTPVLKNVIDWGSRPQGHDSWDKKPAAVVGCSPYSLGAFGAVNHLRQVLVYINTYTLQQPEFYLSMAGDKMDDQGNVTDEETLKLIDDFWTAFTGWIKLTASQK